MYAHKLGTEMVDVEIEQFLNYEMGFSLLMEELIKAKKPLVGHNVFFDLLYVHN